MGQPRVDRQRGGADRERRGCPPQEGHPGKVCRGGGRPAKVRPVPWEETRSASFVARHAAGDAHHAEDLLADLEGFRDELAQSFETLPSEVAVIIHERSPALSLAQPWLPIARLAAAPASRRYMAGWFSSGELHVLSPTALERRAAAIEGSVEALLLSPLHEYAHLAIGTNSTRLPPPFSPRRFRHYLRWAWLCEGAATHLAGQTRYLRAAISRRLREGERPAFPPSPRDAPLLGATVFLLLEREAGREACLSLALTHAADARGAIAAAFGRHPTEVEHDWRALLDRLLQAPAGADRGR